MIRKKLILSLSLLLIAGSLSGCGKEEEKDTTEVTTVATTEETTEATTEVTTEATTEAQNEAEKLGYDKTFVHKTDFGGNYSIPEKFEKTNEESNEGGLWYEFTDKETGIVLETFEDEKRTRKTDEFAYTRSNIEQYSYNVISDEENKIRYTGYDKDLKYFVEIDTLYENVYHYITLTCDESNMELCNEIADIIDEGTTFDIIEGASERLPLLLYGGWYGIKDDELNSFTDEEVVEAINEMYAYKGFIFEDQNLVDYFKGYSWYNPSVNPADFRDSVFSDSEKETLRKLRSKNDYTPSGIPTGHDVTSYDVETIRNKIIEYYTNTCNPAGTYVIFDIDETNTETEYKTILRYQMSEEEEQERIDNGLDPLPNVYACSVTLNKLTGEVTSDTGESWFMD